MNKQIMLVTGATGFIGRNVVEHFSKNSKYIVKATYHRRPPFQVPNVEWIKADLTNAHDINQALGGVEILIQAAATTSGSKDIINQPYIHITDNAVMNSLLFRAAHELKLKRVIFFSCAIMLGADEKAQTENQFDANAEMHANYFGAGWTKVYLEKMAEFYSRLENTCYTVIRHSNIYGPHDKFDLERSHVFGASITKVLRAKDKVTIWGSGKEVRDFLYIDDLIDFIERAISLQTLAYGLYNCGSGLPLSIENLVKKIIDISGKSLELEFDNSAPSIVTNIHLDCRKAFNELGWKPKTSLEDGIQKTIMWWKYNHN